MFGLVGPSHKKGDDEELDNEIQAMIEAMDSGLLEATEEEEEAERTCTVSIPESSTWQQYEKQLKQESNASLTMVPIADANTNLHQELCSKDHASQFQFPEALPAQQAVDQGAITVDNDPVPTINNNIDLSISNGEDMELPARQEENRVFVLPFALGQDQLAAAQQYRATQPHLQRQEPKQPAMSSNKV
jgi:hypothetical protein